MGGWLCGRKAADSQTEKRKEKPHSSGFLNKVPAHLAHHLVFTDGSAQSDFRAAPSSSSNSHANSNPFKGRL